MGGVKRDAGNNAATSSRYAWKKAGRLSVVWSQQPVSVIHMGTPSCDISAMPCSTVMTVSTQNFAKCRNSCLCLPQTCRAHQRLADRAARVGRRHSIEPAISDGNYVGLLVCEMLKHITAYAAHTRVLHGDLLARCLL